MPYIKVNLPNIPRGIIKIDIEDYKGDMQEFIKTIFKKISFFKNFSNEKLNAFTKLVLLRVPPKEGGIKQYTLNTTAYRKKYSDKDIIKLLKENDYLTMTYASMPNYRFAQGALHRASEKLKGMDPTQVLAKTLKRSKSSRTSSRSKKSSSRSRTSSRSRPSSRSRSSSRSKSSRKERK